MIFTNLDILLLVAMGVSGVAGTIRGFTREVLDLIGLVLAVVAAVLAISQPRLMRFIEAKLPSLREDFMAEGTVGMVVFTVVLGCSWLASKSVSDAVKAHGPSSFDRALGLTFGLVRGFLIIVIMLIVNATLYQSVAIKPGAWRLRNNAYSYPIVKSAGEGLIRRAVPYLPSRIAGPASRVRL